MAALALSFPLAVRLMKGTGATRVEEVASRFKGTDARGNIGRKPFVKGVLSMAIDGATLM